MFKSLATGSFVLLWIGFTLNAHAGDPTRPAYLNFAKPAPAKIVKSAPRVPLALNAIFFSEQRKLAIINNQILRVGEQIEDATITDISRNGVTILRRGRSSSLTLNSAATIKHYSSSPSDAGRQP